MQSELAASLGTADYLSVRDVVTQEALASFGVQAPLAPDPAVTVAELFGERIEARAAQGEPARVRAAFPNGYIAFQCSAEFAADATLDTLAEQLGRVMRETGLGVALFRTGAAPWHDSLEVYRRLATRLPKARTCIFESLNIWEICALIARSRAYCGSSLHGLIVAMACRLPCLNILPACGQNWQGKQVTYAATWEMQGVPAAIGIEMLASIFLGATRPSQARLANRAESLAALCMKEMTRGLVGR
jgi:polysaccharide pyruvyl transferase WcaK-like protein